MIGAKLLVAFGAALLVSCPDTAPSKRALPSIHQVGLLSSAETLQAFIVADPDGRVVSAGETLLLLDTLLVAELPGYDPFEDREKITLTWTLENSTDAQITGNGWDAILHVPENATAGVFSVRLSLSMQTESRNLTVPFRVK